MENAYSIFNVTSWVLFAGFVAVTGLAVWFYHRKYPDYPCPDIRRKCSNGEICD